MNSVALLICFGAVFVAGSSLPRDDSSPREGDERTLHFFVLMVPDTTVQELRRSRQEEEVASGVTETGVYVGQIISGVLGGDVRPIFAGSASFIDEPDVQQGVSTILANVAPSLNNILKQWFARVQTALGLTSTLAPGQLANGTLPSNGAIAGQGQAQAQPQRLSAQQQLNQQQQQEQQQYASQSVYINPPSQVVPGSGVLSGSDLFETTTVEPLPLINLKPDEDNEEESDMQKSA